MQQHTISWYEIPECVRQYLTDRRTGPGHRVYLRTSLRPPRAMRSTDATHHSLAWIELPSNVVHYLQRLGVGPGDRLYLGKLRRLSEATLRKLAHELRSRGDAVVAAEVAARYDRRYRTIRGRLHRLVKSADRRTATARARSRQRLVPRDHSLRRNRPNRKEPQ